MVVLDFPLDKTLGWQVARSKRGTPLEISLQNKPLNVGVIVKRHVSAASITSKTLKQKSENINICAENGKIPENTSNQNSCHL